MKLDTANRSFFALLAVALGPYLLLGVFACGSLSAALYEVVTGGDAGVSSGPGGWLAMGFVGLAAASVLVALWSLGRQLVANRRLAARVRAHRSSVPAVLAETAARNRISRVELLPTDASFAFTYGIFAPRVVISSALFEAASADELEAVLAHERYHVATLDPLKTMIARLVPAAFFYLPALGHLGGRYFAGRELAADRRAARRSSAGAIAGALYKTAGTPSPALVGSAVAMNGNDLLEVRITQLEVGREPVLPGVPRGIAVLTLVGLCLSVAGIIATIGAGGGESAELGAAGELLGAAVCGAVWVFGALLLYGLVAARR